MKIVEVDLGDGDVVEVTLVVYIIIRIVSFFMAITIMGLLIFLLF